MFTCDAACTVYNECVHKKISEYYNLLCFAGALEEVE